MLAGAKALARAAVFSTLPPRMAQRLHFQLAEPTRRHHLRVGRNDAQDALLASIAEDGFAVLPAYFEPQTCDEAVRAMEQAFAAHPDHVHHGSDDRLFGIERVIPAAATLRADPTWGRLASEYVGLPQRCMFIMGNKLLLRSSQGSGGGWHRDSFARQLKVIVYLSDVDRSNGPFQIVRASHSTTSIYDDMAKGGLSPAQNRLSALEVSKVVADDPGRIIEITGCAGTAVVFDTSAIHRGAPLKNGARYALTHYMTDAGSLTQAVLDHYSPRL